MAGYTNNPTGPAPALTHYGNGPTSNPTPNTHYTSSPGSGILPPGLPLLWYSAQDIDLLANTTIADGASIGTWKNKGTLGAALDLTQPGAIKPVFRLVAAAGKINNRSAVESDGTQHISSAVTSAIAQPTILVVIFKVTDLVASHTVFDGLGATNNFSVFSGTGTCALYSGTNYNVQAIPAATWETCVAKFNGATSFNRLNGSQSADGAVGAGTATAASLFTVGGATIMKGMIAELMLYGATAPPALADIETYVSNTYGTTPQ